MDTTRTSLYLCVKKIFRIFSCSTNRLIPINLEIVWKNSLKFILGRIDFLLFTYGKKYFECSIIYSWIPVENLKNEFYLLPHWIKVKFRWKWNFSTLNCQFKGYVNCIHKVRPRILIFISFDPLWSSCFSQTNDSLALSREWKFTYIAGSRYPTVLVSGTENDNLFVAVSRLHILTDCHQDTPSMFTIFSLSLHLIINLF